MLGLALALSAVALVQGLHRARQGRCALLKWRPEIEALLAGGNPYGFDPLTTEEGFPTLPATALALAPFLALEDLPAALCWAALKLALAWWMVLTALRMAAGRARDFPPWGALAVVLLSARVLLSDILHGNVNIPIAAVVVAAALAFQRGRDLRAGLWIGLGAVLKATPALFALYFLRKRGLRALAGAVLGVLLFAWLVPALCLGWERNQELTRAWWEQMGRPFLEGTRLELTQTSHMNQSLLGVLARWLTDAVAIPASAPGEPAEVRINLASLSRAELRLAWAAACGLVLLFVAWCARAARLARNTSATLGEFALVALSMLLLSERSWKQHYVVLVLPLAYLAWHAFRAEAARAPGRIALAGLVSGALLQGLSGSGILGASLSDRAEAWGVFLLGALAQLVACGLLLRRETEPGALALSAGSAASR